MIFHYIASRSDGKIVEENIEAEGSAEVLEHLINKGLKPISIKIIKGETGIFGRLNLRQSITISDKVFLTKYLALLLKGGTDILKAIDILVADIEKPALKAILLEMRSMLIKGQPFYEVFAKHSLNFSPTFINLVRAAELSGRLGEVFEELSVSLQKEYDFRNKIKALLTYPIILLTASSVVFLGLLTIVLPKISKVFEGGSVEPPLFSRIVFSIGNFVGDYVWLILGSLTGIIIFSWYFFSKTVVGRKIFYRIMVRTPGIGKTLKKMAIQRFASTLSDLLKAGLPIIESLEITASAVGSEELKNIILIISREKIKKGMTLSEAFQGETVFPQVIVNLIAISEKTGNLDTMLKTLAIFYESEIEASLKKSVSILEPVIILIVGLLVAFIAMAVIIPIYQLVGQFTQ